MHPTRIDGHNIHYEIGERVELSHFDWIDAKFLIVGGRPANRRRLFLSRDMIVLSKKRNGRRPYHGIKAVNAGGQHTVHSA
jgi:hypothetical protein